MRFITAAAIFAASIVGQSPLTTTFASNNGASGNMFDIRATNAAGVTVRTFDVHLNAGTYDLNVYIPTTGGTHVGIEQNPGAWTLIGSATGVTSAGINVPTPLPVCVAQFIPAGTTQGFYVTTTTSGIRYTTGTGFLVGDVYASNTDLEFLAGTGNGANFGSVFGPPSASRIWNGNIYYDLGDTSGSPCTFASVTPYGVGCGSNDPGEAQYELHSAFDLANTGHTYVWTGAGYLLIDGAMPIVPPTAPPTAFGDDDIQPVQLGFAMPSVEGVVNEVAVSSNGWMTFNSTVTDNDLSESVAELLNDPWSRVAFLWDDLNPSSGGSVHLEQVSATEFHITFVDVPEFSATGANNCQLALFDNGTVEVRYGACTLLDCLTGVSPGSGAVDLGGIDFSTLASNPQNITTGAGPFFSGMSVTANPPLVGGICDIVTSGIDPISPVAFTFLGTRASTSIPLSAIGLPAPGCELHLGAVLSSLAGPAANSTATVSLQIGINPALVGQQFSAQSVGLSGANAAGLTTSNGIEVTVGN